jgi:hypothetical protein
VHRAVQLLAGSPVDRQLGSPLDEIHNRCRQLASRRGLAQLVARGEPPGKPRHQGPRQQQRERQDQTGGGEHQPHQGDRRRAGDQRDRKRGHGAKQQVLQRIDVVDQASQQITAAKGR